MIFIARYYETFNLQVLDRQKTCYKENNKIVLDIVSVK